MNDSLTRLQQLYNGLGGNPGSYQEALQALGAGGPVERASSMSPAQAAQAQAQAPGSYQEALQALGADGQAGGPSSMLPIQEAWQVLRGDGQAEGASPMSPKQALGVLHQAEAQAKAQARRSQSPYQGDWQALGAEGPSFVSPAQEAQAQAQAQVPGHVPGNVAIIPQEQLLGLLALGAGDNKGVPQGDPYAASGVGDQQALLQRALQNLTGQAS